MCLLSAKSQPTVAKHGMYVLPKGKVFSTQITSCKVVLLAFYGIYGSNLIGDGVEDINKYFCLNRSQCLCVICEVLESSSSCL